MLFKRKDTVKPLFKKLIKLRENIQNKTKLLKFKKKKWEILVNRYKKRLKRYKKFKPQDQSKYTITRYSSKGTSYKKRFRNGLNWGNRFKLFYGGLSKKELKKYIKCFLAKKKKKNTHTNLLFLKFFESRLDTVLVRAKFSKSLRDARQLITHEKILVNNKLVKSPSYQLITGDLISIRNNQQHIIEENLKYCIRDWIKYKANLWPLPPKHLIINYNTKEIFFENIDSINLATNFSFNLNLEKVILNYCRY